jgi:DNA-binding transcriptional MerR regulator
MRIGELAEKTGLTRDTIRFYERNGLITSAEGGQATNNYRDYPADSVVLLGFLAGAREAGLSVADLAGIVAAMQGSCDRTAGAAVLQAKRAELLARAEQINRAVAFLDETLKVF